MCSVLHDQKQKKRAGGGPRQRLPHEINIEDMIHPTNDNDLEKKRVFIQRTTEAEIKDKPQEYEYDINLIPRAQIDSRYDSTTIN